MLANKGTVSRNVVLVAESQQASNPTRILASRSRSVLPLSERANIQKDSVGRCAAGSFVSLLMEAPEEARVMRIAVESISARPNGQLRKRALQRKYGLNTGQQ